MIFGLPPFYSQNQAVMFERIKSSDVKFPEKPKSTPEARDIIRKLLVKDPTQRLGSQKDVEDLKSHPWFKGFDWEALLARKMPTPFKPKVSGEEWVKNFDEEFTSESIKNFFPDCLVIPF